MLWFPSLRHCSVSRDRWSLTRKAGLFSSLLHVGGSEQSELHVFIGVRGLLLTSVDHHGKSQSPQRTAWFWRHLGRVVRRLSRKSVQRLCPACAGVGSDADNVLFSFQKLPERHHTCCCFVGGARRAACPGTAAVVVHAVGPRGSVVVSGSPYLRPPTKALTHE